MNLFWQIIFRFKIHITVIDRDCDRVVIDYTIFCFQPKCYRTTSEILKIRFVRHSCICAILLKVSVCIKERNIACLLLIVPEEYCTNTVTSMIWN